MNRGDMLHHKALQTLTETEIKRMEHCIGFDRKKTYTRAGMKRFKPYRNHFEPGGTDCEIWASLKEKGFAECGKDAVWYWLNHAGLNILSAIEKVYIYSDNANGNEIDASQDVLEVLLDDAVYCGYGCWLPTPAREIALRARLPKKLTMDTLHYLADKCGYVKKTYEGGIDDEGMPHCQHGWVLSKKWIDENRERYDERQQEEYKRMDDRLFNKNRKEWFE